MHTDKVGPSANRQATGISPRKCGVRFSLVLPFLVLFTVLGEKTNSFDAFKICPVHCVSASFVTFEVGSCNGKVFSLYRHGDHKLYYTD